MEAELIAPCGMNCGVCGNYLAYVNDLRKTGIRKVYCPGCRPRGEKCSSMADSCERLGKGLVNYCYECPDFPCARLKRLDRRYRTKYHLSMIENLIFIREHGMSEFLVKETEKWRCPQCGGVISCHHGLCFTCGVAELKTIKKKPGWTGDA